MTNYKGHLCLIVTTRIWTVSNFQNEDDLKNEDNLKNEGDLKNDDNLKNEANKPKM